MSRRILHLPLAVLAVVAVANTLDPSMAAAQSDMQPPRPYQRTARSASTPKPTVSSAKQQPVVDKPDDRYFAVTGATVHTIGGHTIRGLILEDATVLCKNGKIMAIGNDVVIPEKAEVLDARGYQMYPGLVAVNSSGILGAEPPDDNTDPFGLYMTLGLAGGVTTAVTGNSAAKLTFGTLEAHLLKRDLFYTLTYSRRSPSGRAKFRAMMDRVLQYTRDVQAYEEQKKKDPKAKEPDKSWLKGDYSNALKLIKHEKVARATASGAQDLRDLAQLAQHYGFSLVVNGATEAWTVAPELARGGVRVVITPRTRQDPDERLNRANGSSIENARILHGHGVMLAILPLSTRISMSGLAGRDLMHLPMEAAFAVRGGLPQDAAIRAITLDAARILGVAHRVGSIEVGKDADFAIVDGELLHYMTMVRWTIVNGRIAYDKQKDSLLDHIRPGGDRDAPPPADYWPRSLK